LSLSVHSAVSRVRADTADHAIRRGYALVFAANWLAARTADDAIQLDGLSPMMRLVGNRAVGGIIRRSRVLNRPGVPSGGRARSAGASRLVITNLPSHTQTASLWKTGEMSNRSDAGQLGNLILEQVISFFSPASASQSGRQL